MADVEKAKKLFEEAGLAFPTVPEELAAGLKEQSDWVFATRGIPVSPYNLQHYVDELTARDYVILSHSGHGVNSYAIQYYLVYAGLRMFLHLAWGGVYSDAKADAAEIRDCFVLASKITSAVTNAERIRDSLPLKIVGSDFYGSYWLRKNQDRREGPDGREGPAVVLSEALRWLQAETM